MSARAHERTPFSHLGNNWTDCTENWCVVGGPLSYAFTKDGGYLLDRTRNCAHIVAHLSVLLVHHPNGALLLVLIYRLANGTYLGLPLR